MARHTSAVTWWLCVVAVGGAVSGCGQAARHNRTTASLTGPDLERQFPWLAEVSRQWYQEADLAAGKVPDYSHLGCFPLGNGRVFTTSGLRYPFGTMSNIFGPVYQKRQGSLGAESVLLVVGGRPRDLPRQRVEWVLRSGVVHTSLSDAAGVKLDLYDCVPPEGHAIVRVMVVTNGSRKALRPVALGVTANAGGLAAKHGVLTADSPGRSLRVGFAGARTVVAAKPLAVPLPAAAQKVNGTKGGDTGTTLLCPLGRLRPGESLTKLCYTVIAPSAPAADAEVRTLEQQEFQTLAGTRDWWQKWYADALTVTCPDEKLTDLLPIEQQVLRVQQAEGGGYSPMYMYTTCWVRDSSGPIRFLTQSGKFEEVKRALDYFYGCAAKSRTIPMNCPLDEAVSSPLPAVDWSRAPSPRAEVASLLVLQHYWYARQSGDLTPVREHWGFLRRSLLGQRVDDQGRLPFFGDETYRFPGYQLFEQTHKEPTDWVSMDLLSADSGWECLAAAKAMAAWAPRVGKPEEEAEYEALAARVRRGLEERYWMPDRGFYAPAMSDFSGEMYRYPFAEINLRPLWLAPPLEAGPDALRAHIVSSTLDGLKWLWKASGTLKSTPGCGYYVGMTPGMGLYSLAQLGHVSTPDAIRGVLAAASPAGEYAEMNQPDDTPSDGVWGKNRVRPWEGGINAEALVVALTGFEPDAPNHRVSLTPRLPFGWASLSVQNLRVGASRLSLAVRDSGAERTFEVSLTGADPLTVDLSAPGWHQTLKLSPGATATAKCPRPGKGDFTYGDKLEPPTQAFDYGPPTFAGQAKTVVVTWSGATYAKVRAQTPGAAAIDTKIAFPPEYLAAALYDAGAARRADRLVLEVDRYPGHCKTAEFWTAGAGKKIIDRFRQLGGQVESVPEQQPKPADLFGK